MRLGPFYPHHRATKAGEPTSGPPGPSHREIIAHAYDDFSRDPRVVLETYTGNGFVTGDLTHFAAQAVDILELYDQQWQVVASNNYQQQFGKPKKPKRTHSRGTDPSYSSLPPPPPPPPQRTRQQNPIPVRSFFPWNNQILGSQPSSSLPIPTGLTPEQEERQAQILAELPGIGTWANRQRLFNVKKPFRLSEEGSKPPTLEPVESLAAAAASSCLEERTYSIERIGKGDSRTLEGSEESKQDDFTTPLPPPRNRNKTSTTDNDNNEEEIQKQNGNVLSINQQQTTQLSRNGSSASSEARHVHEAWMWRFSRKWEAEQRRALETDPTTAEPAEGDLDALKYLQACGMGLDLQVLENKKTRGRGRGVRRGKSSQVLNSAGKPRRSNSRLISNGSSSVKFPAVNQNGSGTSALALLRRENSSASSMQFEVEPSYRSVGDLLAAEDSGSVVSALLSTPEASGLPSNPPEATRDLLSVAIRGRQLLERQKELEIEADARWEKIERNCASNWAGSFLSPVEIEMSGRFPCVVLRVAELGGTGRHRFIVRGKQRSSPQELLEDTISQVTSVCSERGLPFISVSLIGGGIVEWRSDTDRHCMVSPAPTSMLRSLKDLNNGQFSSTNNGSPPELNNDVSGLAMSLIKQALPGHFLVTTKAQQMFGGHGHETVVV